MSAILNALMHPTLGNNTELKVFRTVSEYKSAIQKLLFVVVFYTLVSVYYNHVEGWDVEDCIYFITVTITTVGYGDFHPTTDPARMFTVFVILFGLVFIFGIINDFAKFILAYAEQQAAKIQNSKEELDLNADPFKYARKRAYSIFSIFLLVILGSFFFWKNEDWTFIQAFYWCIVTTTTVGYGDMALTHDSSRLFLIFYIPLSVCTVAAALGNLAAVDFEIAAEKKKLENLNRKLDFNMIREMDLDGDGVDRCEFLIAMLVSNGVCDKERDIDPWLKRFTELDADGSGKLDEEDIKQLEAEEEARIAARQATKVGNNNNNGGYSAGTTAVGGGSTKNPSAVELTIVL